MKGRSIVQQATTFARWVSAPRKMARRFVQQQRLKNAYVTGRLTHATRQEPVDPQIVEQGKTLRRRVLKDYADKYAQSGYRILFLTPTVGVGRIWFSDLANCLRHTGITCAQIELGASDFYDVWERFQPNVFIAVETSDVLKGLALEHVLGYKKAKGCLRLFTPAPPERFPESGLSTRDRARLELAQSGAFVDAFMSMMAPEFFERFLGEWAKAGFHYLTLPNACNPFHHYPEARARDLDYFMVTSGGAERLELTHQYLLPIFKKYYGVWAGTGWTFGEGPVANDQLRFYYARTRVAPNPLMSYLVRHPLETSERSFTAAACGAFQITNRTPVTARFFAEDELVCVKDPREFCLAFDHYVDRPEERNLFVLRGMRRVLSEHTYFQRIDTLVRFLDDHATLF